MTDALNFFEDGVETSKRPPKQSRQEILKKIVEGLLFSSSEPLTLKKMREVIGEHHPIQGRELLSLIDALQVEYHKSGRAFQIDEVGGGFLLRTVAEVSPYVASLHANRRGEKLSKAATEVLAIVAYKQPITRPEIEKIRGVDSSGTLASLVERGLVEAVGKLEAPGRPTQFGVTQKFLKYFGLNSLDDLSGGG